MKQNYRLRSWLIIAPEMVESAAFRSLSGKGAILVLLRFLQKAHRKRVEKKSRGSFRNWKPIGEVILSYSEAREALGIKSSSTYHAILHELVEERGFLDVVNKPDHRSAWYAKQPTLFTLSDRWRFYATDSFKRVTIPRVLPKGMDVQSRKKAKLAAVHRSQLTAVGRSQYGGSVIDLAAVHRSEK